MDTKKKKKKKEANLSACNSVVGKLFVHNEAASFPCGGGGGGAGASQ